MCVSECLYVCHLTSVWQDEVCNTMNAIMHLRHVSLSKGDGGGTTVRMVVQRDIISRFQEMLKVIKTGMSRINADGVNL